MITTAMIQQTLAMPVAGASLEIKRAHLVGTTAADGGFVISSAAGVVNLRGKVADQTTASVRRGLAPRVLPGGAIGAIVPAGVHDARIEIFTMQGRRISSRAYTRITEGQTFFTIGKLPKNHPDQIYLIRLTLGAEQNTFSVIQVKGETFSGAMGSSASVNASGFSGASLSKERAVTPIDTLIIHKAFYVSDSIPIPTYTSDLGAIAITRLFADTALCSRITPDSLFNVGLKFYNDSNYNYALLYMEQYLKRYPSAAGSNDIKFYYGRSWYKEDGYDSSLAQLNSFLATRATSLNRAFAQLDIGDCYYAKASIDTLLYQQALTAFNAVLTVYAAAAVECSHALEHIGECYYNYEMNYTQAENTMLQVIGKYPSGLDVPNAQYYVGRCRERAQDYAGALARFNLVLTQYPTSTKCDNCVYWSGRCYHSQAAWSAAVAKFVTLRAAYPTSTYIDNSYYYGCLAYIKLSNCTQAKADFALMQSWYPASPSLTKAQAAVASSCP